MKQAGPQDRKLAAYRRGFAAEYKAALYLLLKGYRILAMRYRTRSGEIDIIARRGDLIAFIEVKARKSLGAGVDAVGHETTCRIRNAADHWLARQKDFGRLSCRFDIVVVLPFRLPRHIENAF